jgi:HEPN domain-containing protein
MRELTVEWVAKAEADFATAGRELRARHLPNYDAASFHAQQTAGKYLKAFLQESGLAFPRTHSLIELLELALTLDSSFEMQRAGLVLLDR